MRGCVGLVVVVRTGRRLTVRGAEVHFGDRAAPTAVERDGTAAPNAGQRRRAEDP
jgi:hypothetical protein